ncbi:hypothetical protein [Aeromonas phage Akh-2]|nr:hypothetical protein [Aeromonas phage Akh-2]
MELALFIYLVETICREEQAGGSGWAFIMALGIICSAIVLVLQKLPLKDSKDSDNRAFGEFLERLAAKKVLVFFCAWALVWNLIPSQRTAYTMLGAYGVQSFATAVYENDQAKRIATNSLNLVESAISKYQKEFEGTK